jgi:hypothetical protein
MCVIGGKARSQKCYLVIWILECEVEGEGERCL